MMGVYIHIPFCNNICSYCDFCKMYYKKEYVDKYLNILEKEIKLRYKNEIVKTIYIGGGTPSSLDILQLDKLLSIISIIKIDNNYEYTIECNIEDINIEKLKLFKKYRINRISIGVESFDDKIIKKLNRHHDREMVFNNINLVKKYFDNINIDLIYGLSDDINIVKEDINCFLKLDIPHISYYSLIIEENTKLYIDKHKYIDESTDKEMFDYINKVLTDKGYNHYEISNYAKDGYESIHNKNYWLNGEYYGFGLSAVSYLNSHRISNTKNLTKYLSELYIEEDNYEDININKENDLILGLRLINGIDIDNYNEKYNDNLLEKDIIKELINNNYLEVVNNMLKCNYKYIYLENYILEKIIGSDL
ncbi:MAG: radical SAM family heme chaperone HemW [Bacilli bacterium]|nr:radical SAM family heme chaperone HemW [Bacilli bacterium]